MKKRCRWFLVWLLPLVWAGISLAATRYHGDEYALFAFGSLAGLWSLWVFGDDGGFWAGALRIIAAGALVMTVLGLVFDLLRAPRRLGAILWLLIAVGVLVTSLSSHPTYRDAISKHGSLLAYVCFALNLGLTLACGLMLVIAPIHRWRNPLPKPGQCQNCGYDLTGNVSGRCPECGRAVPSEGAVAGPD